MLDQDQDTNKAGQPQPETNKHVDLLCASTTAAAETMQDVNVKSALLTNADPADIVELDRQVTQAHGILHAIHHRIKELLGEGETADEKTEEKTAE